MNPSGYVTLKNFASLAESVNLGHPYRSDQDVGQAGA
jgi:hypothetical protein